MEMGILISIFFSPTVPFSEGRNVWKSMCSLLRGAIFNEFLLTVLWYCVVSGVVRIVIGCSTVMASLFGTRCAGAGAWCNIVTVCDPQKYAGAGAWCDFVIVCDHIKGTGAGAWREFVIACDPQDTPALGPGSTL